MPMRSLKLAALGRPGKVGEFYDARTNQFDRTNIISSKVIRKDYLNINRAMNAKAYPCNETHADAFNFLELDMSEKLSLLTDIPNISKEYVTFLIEKNDNSKLTKKMILYRIETGKIELNSKARNFSRALNWDFRNNQNFNPTHIVGSIITGVHLFVTFTLNNQNQEGIKVESTSDLNLLNRKVEEFEKAFSENQNAPYFDIDKSKIADRLSIHIYGTVIPETRVNTLKEAYKIIMDRQKLPEIEKSTNPLTFFLFDINDFAKRCNKKLNTIPFNVLKLKSRSISGSPEKLYAELIQANLSLKRLEKLMKVSHPSWVTDSVKKTIFDFKLNFDKVVHRFQNRLLAALNNYSETSIPEISAILYDFENDSYSPKSVQQFIEENGVIVQKCTWFIRLQKRGIYFEKDLQVEAIRSKEAYIFHFKNLQQSPKNVNWDKLFSVFAGLVEKATFPKPNFYMTDVCGVCDSTIEVGIHHYIGGRLVSDISNLLIDQVRFENGDEDEQFSNPKLTKCYATLLYRDDTVDFENSNSSSIEPLRLTCPGYFNGRCGEQLRDWNCTNCQGQIEFQTDGNAYCGCGIFPIVYYGFACVDENHGDNYLTMNAQQIDSFCKTKPVAFKKEEINIVLMGETGVGKSTFINAFANYLTFETLEKAERSEAVALIHSSFTVADENFEEKIITFGKPDANEMDQNPGSSKTQACKSYVFPMKNNRIRIIDTPGIGDTRGREVDQKNLDGVIKYIANYRKIHCICFLMKPNTARLNVAFRTHFQELFSRLHKTASPNIVFVFTNARSTFYRPGDSFPPLKELLNRLSEKEDGVQIDLTQERYYCLDNESFRYLVLQKHGELFDEDDKRDFAKSWTKSAIESQRLIDYVSNIVAHSIKKSEMVSLVKKTMILLSKAMAEATVKLQNDILTSERKLYLIKISPNVASRQDGTPSNTEKYGKRITSLQNEQKYIVFIRSRLNAYLKTNGLASHFDQTVDDLSKLYSDELFKSNYDEDKKSLLDRLADVQNQYERELTSLTSQKVEETLRTTEDLDRMVKGLYQLRIVGKNIETASENAYNALTQEVQDAIDIEYNSFQKEDIVDETYSTKMRILPEDLRNVQIYPREEKEPIKKGDKGIRKTGTGNSIPSYGSVDTSDESGQDCSLSFDKPVKIINRQILEPVTTQPSTYQRNIKPKESIRNSGTQRTERVQKPSRGEKFFRNLCCCLFK